MEVYTHFEKAIYNELCTGRVDDDYRRGDVEGKWSHDMFSGARGAGNSFDNH